MKKSFLLLAAAGLLATAPSFAQTQPTRTPEQRAERQTENLTRQLGLTPDQAAKVERILQAQRQEAQALRQQSGGDRRALAQSLKAGRAKYDEQLRAVLSPDQYTKYNQLRDERREQMRERRQK